MTFLAPMFALIAAGIAVPTLVLLYFLKLRRRPITVSSTLLWKRAVQDLQVNSPFQKLRRNILLLLQLLILAALLLAFARPTFRIASNPGSRLVIMIDHSASMKATDVKPSRLEVARQFALQEIEGFDGGGGIMVVAFADQARVVQPFTNDRSLLRMAVQNITPTDHFSRLAPALALVEPYVVSAAKSQEASAKELTVEVLTDGRFEGEGKRALHGGRLSFIRIGKDPAVGLPDNLAIVSLSARRDYQRPTRVQVFSRISNYGDASVRTAVSLNVDGRTRGVQSVNVPPFASGVPGSSPVQFELSLTEGAMVTMSHDHADDLGSDNSASVVIAPPRQLRVAMVSGGNAFLERAIASVGVKKLVVMTPQRYEEQDPAHLRRGATGDDNSGFDVIVFEGYSPKAVPPVDCVYFGAAPPVPGLVRVPTSASEPKTQVFLSWKRDHPLMRYVTLDDVLMSEPGRLVMPDKATILATAQSGPVIAMVSGGGTRQVVCSFDVLQTNWPMQVSFPVFISNCLDTLSLSGAGGGMDFFPGDVAVVPTSRDKIEYAGPVTLKATSETGRAVLPMFDQVGVYRALAGVSPPFDALAVNLLNENESNLQPADKLDVGTVTVQATQQTALIRREVWDWFVWAALVILMVEWLVYTRRMHL